MPEPLRPAKPHAPAAALPWGVLCLCALAGLPASAISLEFPGPATATHESRDALDSYALPVGPWRNGSLQTLTTEGSVTRSAWRIAGAGLTTLQIMAPLREQLATVGFTLLFECRDATCGGFDFRYETEVVPEPEMHVDLGDFRFLAAERMISGVPEHVSLLVSRSSENGFVQMVRVGTPEVQDVVLTAATKSPLVLPETGGTAPVGDPVPATPGSLAAALETGGSVPLDDLSFKTGSAELAPGDYASLAELAVYLAAHPDRTVMLVGHTDASGGLESNIVLSKRRAASVVGRMVGALGVSPSQLSAQGVGFLAPRASSLTDDGRSANRRVEVVLTSTE